MSAQKWLSISLREASRRPASAIRLSKLSSRLWGCKYGVPAEIVLMATNLRRLACQCGLTPRTEYHFFFSSLRKVLDIYLEVYRWNGYITCHAGLA